MRDLLFVASALLLLTACQSKPALDPATLSEADWAERVVVATLPSGSAPVADELAANAAVEAALQRTVTVLFDENALGDILEYLRDTTGANITVNWASFDIVGIYPDSPITLSLDRVTAERLLVAILEQASAEQFEEDKAGYTIYQGVVVIDLIANLHHYTTLRVYDARGLVEADRWDWVRWYADRPEAERLDRFLKLCEEHGYDIRLSSEAGRSIHGGGNSGGGGGGGGTPFNGGGGLFGDDDIDQTSEAARDARFRGQLFTWMLQESVGTYDEWLDEDSIMEIFNGMLIVRTTHQNHQDMENLLLALYRKQATEAAIHAR